MYKLLHALFGWDYLHWQNCADSGVARIHCTGGKVWYWRYKLTRVIDYIDDPRTRITYLTCDPEKYTTLIQ